MNAYDENAYRAHICGSCDHRTSGREDNDFFRRSDLNVEEEGCARRASVSFDRFEAKHRIALTASISLRARFIDGDIATHEIAELPADIQSKTFRLTGQLSARSTGDESKSDTTDPIRLTSRCVVKSD